MHGPLIAPTTRRALLALIAGLSLAAAAPAAVADANARLFDRVWDEVDRRYWDRARLGEAWNTAYARYRPQAIAAPDETALYRILSAMLATVGDSHVYIRTPGAVRRDADADAGADSAQFGLSAWPTDGVWRVLAVRADGPAAAAGVRPGWLIDSVDGRPVDDDWHPRAGQRARFAFRDLADRPRTLDLVSTLLPPEPARRATRLGHDVLLLAFDVFAGGEDRWMVDEIAADPPAALILDLRENEGGEALSVARVAGLLFDRKRTLLNRVARGRTLAVPIVGAGRRSFAGPLAVLVGPRSASGAEILAALVQDSGRGVVVGGTTAGAVTGAARTLLPDGGELWVAVFDIRTANDVRLEGRGLVPAFPVVQSLAQLRAGIDPVLARALALLAGHTAVPAAP
ncbi:S41 family peptidase [Sphingomonas montana]|uniref:S41 family peptidase n=1 Tax=Sphingomonas montana TaxID=1843236 RepID=UPI00096C2D46|nr:S41 family peptidase [Sphingomonas montana]